MLVDLNKVLQRPNLLIVFVELHKDFWVWLLDLFLLKEFRDLLIDLN